MVAPSKNESEVKEENEELPKSSSSSSSSSSSEGGEEEEEEDYEDDDNFENDHIIRAKWCIDGAGTLDEVVDKLHEFIGYIQSLKAEGYELRGPVEDDYGFLTKK